MMGLFHTEAFYIIAIISFLVMFPTGIVHRLFLYGVRTGDKMFGKMFGVDHNTIE